MRKPLMYMLMCLLAGNALIGCKARKDTGSKTRVPKNSPVPVNNVNIDSTGTSPSAKLTPTPVPNTRPNPIPNPPPPNPPQR